MAPGAASIQRELGQILLKTYAIVAVLGALTGSILVAITVASGGIFDSGQPSSHAWLVVPASAPFGMHVAMMIRQAMRNRNATCDWTACVTLAASTIVAFILAAGSADFLLSDDNAPDYAMSGGVGGLVGAGIVAIAIRIMLGRRNIRFVWWPVVVAGAAIGALATENTFYMNSPPTVACLLFPLWQASVATGLWCGLSLSV